MLLRCTVNNTLKLWNVASCWIYNISEYTYDERTPEGKMKSNKFLCLHNAICSLPVQSTGLIFQTTLVFDTKTACFTPHEPLTNQSHGQHRGVLSATGFFWPSPWWQERKCKVKLLNTEEPQNKRGISKEFQATVNMHLNSSWTAPRTPKLYQKFIQSS